jgi:hypothetical protein
MRPRTFSEDITFAGRSSCGRLSDCSRYGCRNAVTKSDWGRTLFGSGNREKGAKASSVDDDDDDRSCPWIFTDQEVPQFTPAVRISSVWLRASLRKRCRYPPSRVIGVFGSIVDPIEAERDQPSRPRNEWGLTWLCTGDHEVTAKAVAEEIGIEDGNISSWSHTKVSRLASHTPAKDSLLIWK